MGSLSDYGSVLGMDIELQALRFSRRRGHQQLCQADLKDLPFSSSQFDAVTVLDVLEHVDDDGNALSEICRILKPGGVAVINVPAYQWLWSGKDTQVHHRRRYTRRRLLSQLPLGLRVDHLSFWNTTLLAPIALTRLYQRWRGITLDLEQEWDPPEILNRLLTRVMWIERPLVRWPGLPFGVSLLCTLTKRD